MLSRSLAILVASWLPGAALMLPLSRAHATNALVAGTLAFVLSAFSLTSDRVRLGAALLGVWVALTGFIFPSTLLEEVVTVSWGVTMFAFLAGPFSDPPLVSRVVTVAPVTVPVPVSVERELARAA